MTLLPLMQGFSSAFGRAEMVAATQDALRYIREVLDIEQQMRKAKRARRPASAAGSGPARRTRRAAKAAARQPQAAATLTELPPAGTCALDYPPPKGGDNSCCRAWHPAAAVCVQTHWVYSYGCKLTAVSKE